MLFNSEFYPTPEQVLHQMQIDCSNKICLEPHAGKGDIIDFLHTNGAKEVYSCEINQDLAHIVQNKSHWEKLNRAYAKIKGEVLPEKL